MLRLRVYKVVLAEKVGTAKDYWMVPAKNLQDAITKAERETAKDWELEAVTPVEGDFIMPTKRKRTSGVGPRASLTKSGEL